MAGLTVPTPGFSNYYRLRMIDTDGSFEYSRIIYINNRMTKSVVGNFYPNPSSGPVFVDVYAEEGGQWTVTVVTAAGRVTGKRTYDLQKGKNTIRLEQFVDGVNLVRFEYGGLVQSKKADPGVGVRQGSPHADLDGFLCEIHLFF